MKGIKRVLAMFMAMLMMLSVVPLTAEAATVPSIELESSCKNMKVVTGDIVYLDFLIERNYKDEYYIVNIYEGRSTSEDDLIGYAEDYVDYDADSVLLSLYFSSADWELSVGSVYTVECYLEYWNGSKWVETKANTGTFQIIKNTCGGKHTYGNPVSVFEEATCTENGFGAYNCTKCGARKRDIIAKKGHKYGSGVVTKNPTCTAEGVKTYTCTSCGYKKTESIAKVAHVYDEGVVSVAPTCTTDGVLLYTCVNCHTATKQEVIPAAHTWDEGERLIDPTVSKAGLKYATCEVCGISDEVEIPAIFSDMYDDWFTSYVQYVYDNSLMTGIKGTTKFAPNANITKAQVAQVLYNMEGQPEVTTKLAFIELSDVYEAEWYANAVEWAYQTGVVTGDLNVKKFYPNADVTREQLALMMYRYANYKGYDVSASGDLSGMENEENTSNWARTGVEWAVGAGLISGIDKGDVKDLAPQGNASRAQMAAILQRFCVWVEENKNTYASESVAALVEYIMENGAEIVGEYEIETEEGTFVMENSISYNEEENNLTFLWHSHEGAYEVFFEYDAATAQAVSPVNVTISEAEAGSCTLEGTEDFDIAAYTYDTVLGFEIFLNELEYSEEEVVEFSNELTKLAVLSWSMQLMEQVELMPEDIGFTAFVDSLPETEAAAVAAVAE